MSVTAKAEAPKSSIIHDLHNGAFESTKQARDFLKPVDLNSLQHKFWFAGLQTRQAGERDFFSRLTDKPELLHETDEDGLTLTHHLAQLGKVRILKLLGEFGLSTFAEADLKGRYPVHYASNPATAEFLFANTKVLSRRTQLDPALTLTDKTGKLPLHVMIESGQTNTAIAVVRQLCSYGLSSMFYGTGLNTPDPLGRTAIHFAAIANDLAVMDELVRCGIVDREVRDRFGRTALHYASEHANFSSGYALIGRNHAISPAQRSADKNGDKAIDIARKSKSAAGVEILTRLNN